MNYGKEFTKGILKENPTLVGLLGMWSHAGSYHRRI